jgi:hypothetical protein
LVYIHIARRFTVHTASNLYAFFPHALAVFDTRLTHVGLIEN